ncbi:MAG: hydroxyisourate hydrolase [Sandaracinaceae bacterium]
MSQRSPITTHVLDTARGRPAAGVPVRLFRQALTEATGWIELAAGVTDADGRISDLLAPGSIPSGTYRIDFDVGSYCDSIGVSSFYPHVSIAFTIAAGNEHYHVPLLLSPYGYSTYRGS